MKEEKIPLPLRTQKKMYKSGQQMCFQRQVHLQQKMAQCRLYTIGYIGYYRLYTFHEANSAHYKDNPLCFSGSPKCYEVAAYFFIVETFRFSSSSSSYSSSSSSIFFFFILFFFLNKYNIYFFLVCCRRENARRMH